MYICFSYENARVYCIYCVIQLYNYFMVTNTPLVLVVMYTVLLYSKI